MPKIAESEKPTTEARRAAGDTKVGVTCFQGVMVWT